MGIVIHSIRFDRDTILKFSYNKPGDVPNNDYALEIIIEDLFSDNMEMEELLLVEENKVMAYFRMIEKVINTHFDPSYSIPRNKNLLDAHYWRKVWDRVHLNDHSFDHDINRFIAGIVEEFHE